MNEDIASGTWVERRRHSFSPYVWSGRAEDLADLPHWMILTYRTVELDGVLHLARDGVVERQQYDDPNGWAHRREPLIRFLKSGEIENWLGHLNYSGTWVYGPGVIFTDQAWTREEFLQEFEEVTP